jgi:hypothetical protein
MEEKYPPGTRVERIGPSTQMFLAGTVMDIPLHSNPAGLAMYQILFDNRTSASIPLADKAFLITSPPVVSGVGPHGTSPDNDSYLLPLFLQVGSCITYEHDGEYHKGFLTKKTVALIVSVSKLMPRRSLRTGGSTFPTCLSSGLICVQKAFCFRAMWLIHLSIHHHTTRSPHLHPLPPLIWLQTS